MISIIDNGEEYKEGMEGEGGGKQEGGDFFAFMLWDVIHLFPTMQMGERGQERVRRETQERFRDK